MLVEMRIDSRSIKMLRGFKKIIAKRIWIVVVNSALNKFSDFNVFTKVVYIGRNA